MVKNEHFWKKKRRLLKGIAKHFFLKYCSIQTHRAWCSCVEILWEDFMRFVLFLLASLSLSALILAQDETVTWGTLQPTAEERVGHIRAAKSCVTSTSDMYGNSITRYVCGSHTFQYDPSPDGQIHGLNFAVERTIGEIVSTGMVLTNCLHGNSRDGIRCFFYRPTE